MKSILAVAIALFLISIGPAVAQAPTSCAQLLAAYDSQDRQIAMTAADGLSDDSAPRATVRELRNLNRQIQKLGLIEIMRGRNCTLPNDTNGHLSYDENASRCRHAIVQANLTSTPASEQTASIQCDQSKWVKGGGIVAISKPAASPPASAPTGKPPQSQQTVSAPQGSSAGSPAEAGSMKLTPGLVVSPLNDFIATAVDFPGKTGGLIVMEVVEGGAAQKAGVIRGDIIISANGYLGNSQAAMSKAINDFGPGFPVRLKIWRDRTERDLFIR